MNHRHDTEGLFITFEGLEGAGKSTQADMLVRYLEREGYPVLQTREPGGTPIGEAVRDLLIDPRYKEMDPLTEVFLFAAARRQHVEQVIRPQLAEGNIVVCDRFSDATMAYQGYGGGVHLTQIREVNAMTLWRLQPDLTFYLDVEPYLGIARLKERYHRGELGPDRIERNDIGFFERVREGYLDLAREENRVRCLDGSAEPQVVHQKVVDIVMREVTRRIPNPRRLSTRGLNLDDL